jgi:mRNA interferase RelE/StbE
MPDTPIWKLEWSDVVKKALRKLPVSTGTQIVDYLEERIITVENPRIYGKALTGKLKGLWRYRVNDYRIICHIKDETVTVLVVDIGHRKDIYR